MTDRFQKAPKLQEHITKVLEQAAGSTLHHWVPQFLLRQFSDEPQADNPGIWCMTVDGSRPRLSCVHDECAIKGHNLLIDPGDLPEAAIEGLYGYIEGLAAPMVRTLIDGGSLNSEERSALSMFFAVQEQRTPRSRSERREVLEKLRTAVVAADVVNRRDEFDARARKHLRNRHGRAPTPEEITAFVDGVISDLQSGKIRLSAPHDFDAGSGLLAVQHLAPLIYGMTWIGLHAPANVDFVIGDEPIVHYDQAGPGRSAAWLSSAKAETILPLSSDFCLLFRPGPASYQQTTVDEATVMYVNLRSAAATWRNYYGRSKSVVEAVRRVIEVHPEDYERLKPVPGQVYLAHRYEDELVPYRVDVLKPSDSVKISRPRRRSDRHRSH